MKKQRLLAIILVCLFMFSMAACSSKGGNEEKPATDSEDVLPLEGKLVGVSPFWLDACNSSYCTSIKEYLEPLGVEVQILDPNGDSAVQRQQIQDWITMGADAVIWSPCETSQLIALTEQMQKADIRSAVFFNTVTADELEAAGISTPQYELDQYQCFYDMANEAVDYVMNELGETPNVVIFGCKSNPVLDARARGFYDGLEATGKEYNIVYNDEVEFEQEDGRNKVMDLLTSNPELNIIVPHTGNSGVGAYSALQSSNRGKAGDEWICMVEGDTQRMELFLDDATSVQAIMLPDCVGGGTEIAKNIEKMLGDENWKSDNSTGVVDGLAFYKSMKAEAIKEYERQNSSLDDYEPFDVKDYE